MANGGDMTALDERSPGFFGIIGGQTRRDDQRNGKSAEHHTTDEAENAPVTHDMSLPLRAPRFCELCPRSRNKVGSRG